MSLASPYAALVALLITVALARFLGKRLGIEGASYTYAPLHGLRGLLAILVLLHHAMGWYYIPWPVRFAPAGHNLFTHFGQGSVVLFFMMTSFLFIGRLLDCRIKGMDWRRFYTARLLRLFPMYALSLIPVFAVVAYETDYALREPLADLAWHVFHAFAFAFGGDLRINGQSFSITANAGVTWTLWYEWFFYLALPIFGLLILKRAPRWPYILLGFVSLALLTFWPGLNRYLLLPFLCGAIVRGLIEIKPLCHVLRGPFGVLLAVVTLGLAVLFYPQSYDPSCVGLYALFFLVVAGGNGFGFLTRYPLRVLGDISYSVYLLHGIVFYITFHGLVGLDTAATYSPFEHWLVVLPCLVLTLSLSALTFRWIERPSMSLLDRLLPTRRA